MKILTVRLLKGMDDFLSMFLASMERTIAIEEVEERQLSRKLTHLQT